MVMVIAKKFFESYADLEEFLENPQIVTVDIGVNLDGYNLTYYNVD
jgi:hypothetical protein